MNRLVLEDDCHINKGSNNDVIVENEDGDGNYDNLNNHNVQMLDLKKTFNVDAKGAKSLFEWY